MFTKKTFKPNENSLSLTLWNLNSNSKLREMKWNNESLYYYLFILFNFSNGFGTVGMEWSNEKKKKNEIVLKGVEYNKFPDNRLWI